MILSHMALDVNMNTPAPTSAANMPPASTAPVPALRRGSRKAVKRPAMTMSASSTGAAHSGREMKRPERILSTTLAVKSTADMALSVGVT